MSRTLIVTGASGHLGRRVVELLLEKGLANTRLVATTRTPEKLADLAQRGVIIRRADFADHESLIAAFKGGDRLLLVSTDSVFVPGERSAQQKAAVRAAVAAGVKHVVYVSATGLTVKHPVRMMTDHIITEAELATHPALDFTIVRSGYWFDNLLHALPAAVNAGAFAGATGDGRVAFVTREEAAIVAAAELASDRTGRSTVSVTGPAAVSYAELIQAISDVIGKKIAYVPVPKEAKAKMLADYKVPPFIAELVVQFEVSIAEGYWAAVAPAHPALAKRTTVAEWIAQNRAALTGGQQ